MRLLALILVSFFAYRMGKSNRFDLSKDYFVTRQSPLGVVGQIDYLVVNPNGTADYTADPMTATRFTYYGAQKAAEFLRTTVNISQPVRVLIEPVEMTPISA